ncbi:ROK family protein (plasmid) [Arthrobacter sp. UC242_113]|uniref:ROK family transcriptional regulator n=1 Tax=Arthrobacter sp. UC242_113 TaxID=3374550 RepID=UPI0037571D07
MDTHNLRDRSRVNVLETVLQDAPVTRDRVITKTGLSKATVSRVVEELRIDGYLSDGTVREHAGRGRRSTYLDLAEGLGYVVGIDLGANSTRMVAGDLRGRHLGTLRTTTPGGLSTEEAVRWVAEQLARLTGDLDFHGDLTGVAVAVPGRVMGTQLTRPAPSAHQLAGTEFHSLLERKLGVRVYLDNDANLALLSEITDGTVAGRSDVALLSVSTTFGASIAVQGSILKGRSIALGELGVLGAGPNGAPLDRFLSVNGLMETAAQRGLRLDAIEDLWEKPATGGLAELINDFTAALTSASAVFSVTFDPEAIVYNGRLRPLMQTQMAEVESGLVRLLATSPQLHVTPQDGYSVAKGALEAAIQEGRAAALQRVLERRAETAS